MKNLLVLTLLLLSLTARVSAQEIEKDSEATPRTRLGVSAGPTYLQYYYKAFFPAFTYHVGIFGVRSFRRLDVLVTAQYIPMHITYRDFGGYADFTNHAINFVAIARFPIAFDRRLTLDIGASFAHGLSHKHSEYTTLPPWLDYMGYLGQPQTVDKQLFFVIGSSWKLTRHNTVSLTGLFSYPTQSWGTPNYGPPDYGWYPQYYMVQASVSHAF